MKALNAVLAGVMLAWFTLPAAAAPWERGFVVSEYYYAFKFGGGKTQVKAGLVEPGSDCPHGSTQHFASEANLRAALKMQPWRTPEQIDAIAAPPGQDTVSRYNLTRFHVWNRAVAYRGFRRGVETYVNPHAAPDPGQPEVTGTVAEGFNLDNDARTGRFTSPEGEKGIDNALYRAWGCDAPWRGENPTLVLRANDKMQEGLYTMVIRLSGNQDPMNDSDAVLEIGYSPDYIVKDSSGKVGADFSYRIAKTAQYSKVKARIRNGLVESVPVDRLHAPRVAWFANQTGDADFHQGRIRFQIDDKGYAGGHIGGYRNWRDLYAENTFAQDGGQQGIREHEDHISLYYALRRNADGMADPATGEKTGISTAYRIKAVPAFVVDPEKPVDIPLLAANVKPTKAFQGIRAAFIKATTTRVIQDVPPGTTEASVPTLDRLIVDLPSKDYLLSILDRPHYPDEPEEKAVVPPPGKQASATGE
jgi:hypothetical protein